MHFDSQESHGRDADGSRQEAARLAAEAEKLRWELERVQAASRQLAAGSHAEAARVASETEALQRELSAARSAHGRAVTAGNKVRSSSIHLNSGTLFPEEALSQ